MTEQVKDAEDIEQNEAIENQAAEPGDATQDQEDQTSAESQEIIDDAEAGEEADSEEKSEAEVVEEEEEIPPTPEELIAGLKDALLRQRADFDNFRKRSVKDQSDARQRGKTGVLEEVLPVFDTFKMAMMATEGENVNLDIILQGMNMIQNTFIKALDDMGVTELKSVGEKFDPNIHEATSEAFSEEFAEGMIISQIRCGYKLGDRLLRPATIVVSKGLEKKED